MSDCLLSDGAPVNFMEVERLKVGNQECLLVKDFEINSLFSLDDQKDILLFELQISDRFRSKSVADWNLYSRIYTESQFDGAFEEFKIESEEDF